MAPPVSAGPRERATQSTQNARLNILIYQVSFRKLCRKVFFCGSGMVLKAKTLVKEFEKCCFREMLGKVQLAIGLISFYQSISENGGSSSDRYSFVCQAVSIFNFFFFKCFSTFTCYLQKNCLFSSFCDLQIINSQNFLFSSNHVFCISVFFILMLLLKYTVKRGSEKILSFLLFFLRYLPTFKMYFFVRNLIFYFHLC